MAPESLVALSIILNVAKKRGKVRKERPFQQTRRSLKCSYRCRDGLNDISAILMSVRSVDNA